MIHDFDPLCEGHNAEHIAGGPLLALLEDDLRLQIQNLTVTITELKRENCLLSIDRLSTRSNENRYAEMAKLLTEDESSVWVGFQDPSEPDVEALYNHYETRPSPVDAPTPTSAESVAQTYMEEVINFINSFSPYKYKITYRKASDNKKVAFPDVSIFEESDLSNINMLCPGQIKV